MSFVDAARFAEIYWSLAVLVSLFLGWFSFEIHQAPKLSKPQIAQQVWLNTIGALVGWTALWILLRLYAPCVTRSGYCPAAPPITKWSVLAALVAFFGITGYIPAFTVQPIQIAVRSTFIVVSGGWQWLMEKAGVTGVGGVK